jgi:hypothetical protein
MISHDELIELANENSELSGKLPHLIKLIFAVRNFQSGCVSRGDVDGLKLGKQLDVLVSKAIVKNKGNSRVKTRAKPRQCRKKSTGTKSKKLI